MTSGPRSLRGALAAVELAKSLVGTGVYQLGTGDWDTRVGGQSDCAGFAICKCYGLRRHRPGFNRGAWASVSDDINCNSLIEDADHARELAAPVTTGHPQIGDLLTYPTFTVSGHRFIGHVVIVTGIGRLLEWDWARPTWGWLDVAQCLGPNGRKPGIIASTAVHFDDHDKQWPKDEHRSRLLRML